jgi:hypothetical protein
VDSDLLAAFQSTDYRVRLTRGGWATIRLGQPLPAALRVLTSTHPWGFITAWNPRSQSRSRQCNRAAQRQLLAALRALPTIVAIYVARGVGNHWHEPSLFVSGLDTAALDTLARQHEQLAYVHGQAGGEAHLRWLN